MGRGIIINNSRRRKPFACLENGTGAVAVASGMAAQFVTFMTLLAPGDEIVASAQLRGGSVTQLTHTLKTLSVTVRYVDPTQVDNWAKAITPKTKALYGETVGNPRGSVLDLEALAELAKSRQIPLIVDNTFGTRYLCRPIDWGASIVVYAATKFIGGHGNSIDGVVIDSGTFDYGRFPTIAGPLPSYHGLRFYDTIGHYGFLVKVRVSPPNRAPGIRTRTSSATCSRHAGRSLWSDCRLTDGRPAISSHPTSATKAIASSPSILAMGKSWVSGSNPASSVFRTRWTWWTCSGQPRSARPSLTKPLPYTPRRSGRNCGSSTSRPPRKRSSQVSRSSWTSA
jgi:hypothetical protein